MVLTLLIYIISVFSKINSDISIILCVALTLTLMMVDYTDTLNELKILHLNIINDFLYIFLFKIFQITYIIKKETFTKA